MTSSVLDSPPSDEALLDLMRQQDVQALGILYDRHAQTVYSLIVRIVQEPGLAEELLQETFWQVWKGAGRFRGEGSVAAWLYRIARKRSLDRLRRRRARPVDVPRGERDDREEMGGEGEEVQAATNWRREHMRHALRQIPAEQRLCLELAYFEGLSQRQIADRTHTPLGTIKTHMRIGLVKLARLLRAASYWEGDR